MTSVTLSASCRRDGVLGATFKTDFKEKSSLLGYLLLCGISDGQYVSFIAFIGSSICTFLFLSKCRKGGQEQIIIGNKILRENDQGIDSSHLCVILCTWFSLFKPASTRTLGLSIISNASSFLRSR
jgi:hypothetical protein